jgi:hypothetical protein
LGGIVPKLFPTFSRITLFRTAPSTTPDIRQPGLHGLGLTIIESRTAL